MYCAYQESLGELTGDTDPRYGVLRSVDGSIVCVASAPTWDVCADDVKHKWEQTARALLESINPDNLPLDLGQQAYCIYGDIARHLNHDGKPLPMFSDLLAVQRHKWMDAAYALFGYTWDKSGESP